MFFGDYRSGRAQWPAERQDRLSFWGTQPVANRDIPSGIPKKKTGSLGEEFSRRWERIRVNS